MYYFNYDFILVQDPKQDIYFAINRKTREKFLFNKDMFILLSELYENGVEDNILIEIYGDLINDLSNKKIILPFQQSEKCLSIRTLKDKFPLKGIFLEVSKKCNLYCQHCYASASNKHEDILSYENICNLIDQSTTLGAYSFKITGGEPFLRKDINDIVRYLWKKGFIITIYSNLTTLSDENLKTIIECGVNVVTSIDYIDSDKHDRFRGKKDALKETLMNINKIKSKTNNIAVNIVVNNKTDEEINELANYIKFNLNLSYYADIIQPAGRGEKYKITQHNIDSYVYTNYICNTDMKCNMNDCLKIEKDSVCGYNCNVGKDFLFVNSDGECSLCPTLTLHENKEFYFGNILEDSIFDMWQSEKRVRFNSLNCKYINICPKSSECSGSCRSKAYHLNGNVFDPDPIMCNIYGVDVNNFSSNELNVGGK